MLLKGNQRVLAWLVWLAGLRGTLLVKTSNAGFSHFSWGKASVFRIRESVQGIFLRVNTNLLWWLSRKFSPNRGLDLRSFPRSPFF